MGAKPFKPSLGMGPTVPPLDGSGIWDFGGQMGVGGGNSVSFQLPSLHIPKHFSLSL